MQIERSFEETFVFAFPASGSGDGCFQVAGAEAFLNRQREGWVRTDFQPDVDAEVGESLDGGNELDGLSNTASPMGGGAV